MYATDDRDVYAEIYCKAAGCREFEPVPGDFSMKVTSMDILSYFADISGSEIGLEIGCGSGFSAALLSSSCRRLVATDLPLYDARTHSLGISVAKGLLSKLDVNNVDLVSCSGESLPFADDIFDYVYSSSVLEHIDDKEKALKEMIRVAKPGGAVIFIIPTYIQSLCAFLHLYLYVARRMFDVIKTRLMRRAPSTRDNMLMPKLDDSIRSNHQIIGSFRKNHPSFPFPQPHGSYNNIIAEFVEQLPWNWAGLARRCGADSVETCAMLFLPFNILEIFSTRLIARFYRFTSSLHKILGASALKYYAYALCVMARKKR